MATHEASTEVQSAESPSFEHKSAVLRLFEIWAAMHAENALGSGEMAEYHLR